jgi:phosphoribosylformylglycinamidine synthase
MVWHRETSLPKGLDLVVIPGGFSYGDYLRSGAMAARSPIVQDIVAEAGKGLNVAGFCNGFQILTEAGLLPGALMRNKSLKYVCKPQKLTIVNGNSRFTSAYQGTRDVVFPIAHHDGNYFADDETLNRLEKSGRVIVKYNDNPNGSARDIAGICNEAGNVMGMMPHPERAIDPLHGGTDGIALFKSILESV